MTIPADVVDAILRIESQTCVRRVAWFEEIDSTNNYALEIGGNPQLETPRLIWADRQHAGRGRSGRAWWSQPGGLTFSLLFDAADLGIESSNWPKVSLLTGLAVAEALTDFLPGTTVGVKWPNDVFADDRKICGILIEPVPELPSRLVVGIGINVANSLKFAPAELQSVATSIWDQTTARPGPIAVLLAVLEKWDSLIAAYARSELDLPSAWRRRCVLTDRRVGISTGDSFTEGRCLGIDSDGALLLETSQGITKRMAGTVRLLSDR